MLSKDKIKIHYTRKTWDGCELQIVSIKGNRKYLGDEFKQKEDRLFFIRLIEGEKQIDFPYKYDDQKELLKLVMGNIILPNIFDREINIFEKLIEEIKEERKNENKD